MDLIEKQTINEKIVAILKRAETRNILYARWVLVLAFFPMFLSAYGFVQPTEFFINSWFVTFFFNVGVTIYLLYKGDFFDKLPEFIFYIDIAVICLFNFMLGGIDSEIFIYFIFLIAYFGISINTPRVFMIASLSVAGFIISGIIGWKVFGWRFDVMHAIIKSFFIMMAAYGTTLILVKVRKYDKLHRHEFNLARTDKLTGLLNRHYLEQKLQELSSIEENEEKTINVLMFDLDNFKKFNDTYGHVSGDELLSFFSKIIKNNIRRDDAAIRYGGEEFLILVKEMDIEVAKKVANRIRRELEKEKIIINDGENVKKVTVSCGISQFPLHSKDIKEAIKFADKALYCAKETGKNKVVGYDELLQYEELIVKEELLEKDA